jgi:HAMP domain-containing protein
MKLSVKITFFVLLLFALGFILSAFVFFSSFEKAIITRTEEHLNALNSIKKSQLDSFFLEQKYSIKFISENSDISDYMNLFHSDPEKVENGLYEEQEEKKLSEHLNKIINATNFFELFILKLNGEVDVSTDMSQKGKIKTDESYFNYGKDSTYLQAFYFDFSLNSPAITISIPLHNSDNEFVGLLVGRIKDSEIKNIMKVQSGLGESEETLIINSYRYAVTDLKKKPGSILRENIHTKGAVDCLEKKNKEPNNAIFKDYAGDDVIASYVWLEDYNSCMISKLDTKDAFADLESLKIRYFIIMGCALCVLLFASFFLVRVMILPLTNLNSASEEIAKGNLNNKIVIKTGDEIETLGESFNTMVSSLRSSKEKINADEKNLEKTIEERTKQLKNKVDELEKFQKVTIDRELKMIELKKKINEMGKEKKEGKK